ncbi:hypothetical protein QQ008_11875 [Fulvivirgaceae bacterium BMA10]|uniref:Co-chaperone DjlA N-terminal domain-containing protein n=1 Tax=Splendidivirga corallicola TaxID=3051826 RepID=A0ABT8KMY9_9BACT|nr:hypothetical protein [Fulvivirgaceae bacterium BMA10]
MVGFFEHQYLKYKKQHLGNLVAMAYADGHLHESEKELLLKIGKNYGLKEWQIEKIIDNPEKLSLNIPSDVQNRLDQLFDLVSLILADGVVNKNEMTVCEHITESFGFAKSVIDDIMEMQRAGEVSREDWTAFKEDHQKYLLAEK